MGKRAYKASRGINGVRLDPNHAEKTRAKIQTSQLINRLNSYANGEINMTTGQVTAALGLLDRTLPKLTATELSGQVERTTVIRAPESTADSKAWLEKYGPAQPEPEAKPDKLN